MKNSHFREIPLAAFCPDGLLRIWTIAMGTVTQLLRMKTFYFLIAFALLVAGLANIDITSASAVEKLAGIKKIAFGAMDNFAWLYALAATALLIPRDLEDRTLYTILCKPVRRVEYLLGKLLGVLIVVAVALAVMFLLCLGLLFLRETGLINETLADFRESGHFSPEDLQQQIDLIRAQGPRAGLAFAALASFLKASVVAAMAILISTFASSSLFTIITSIFFFLIGHAHGMMTEFWSKQFGENIVLRFLIKLFKLLIPDYQIFSFSEGIVAGGQIIPSLVSQMGMLTLGYLVLYLLLSLMIFLNKEF